MLQPRMSRAPISINMQGYAVLVCVSEILWSLLTMENGAWGGELKKKKKEKDHRHPDL